MSYKKHIVDTMKRLYDNKFISIRDGNVSFKPKNEQFFYISAGSIKKNGINEDQVIKIDFKNPKSLLENHGNHLNQDLFYNKKYKYQPSREIYMHSFLQTNDDNYNKDIFVIHAHPPNIINYIGINKSNELNNIKNTFPEINVGKIGKNVKYYEAGSLQLATNCFFNLLNNDIIGLERHGSLSIGNDIDELFENIETLEYYTGIELDSKY